MRHVNIIESSSMRASELVQQILAFSRGAEPVNLTVVDLNRLIHETCGLLESSLGKRIQLQLNLNARPTLIKANATQVQQALINLCLNARDAMPRGGAITVATDCVDLQMPAMTLYKNLPIVPGDYMRLRVVDQGMGISRTHLNNIFDPFFTTKEVGKGTGLGLAMVYGIVKNANGYVHVDSQEGIGSTFDLLFQPAETSENRSVPVDAPDRIGGQETLLLVDDESMVLDIGKEILSGFGYQVLVAADGREALKIYDDPSKKVDLVILDLVMPNMDGARTYQELIKLDPQVKIIICSGHGAKEIADNPGMASLPRVGKPFQPQKMARTIRSLLDDETNIY